MKIYEQNDQELGEFIHQSIEKEAGKKIFTIIFLGEKENVEELETLVVFEDKSVLNAVIFIQTIKGQLAARIRGNYI